MSDTDKLMLRALRCEPVERPPVWLMRQAGRYLPEYRALRQEAGGFLDLVRDPRMSAEITLQPVRRFGMDAAILFSDILLPLAAMGMPLVFDERGPVLPEAIRSRADVEALSVVDPRKSLAHVGETLGLVKAGLSDATTLIGFCGAPFTLASYAIEGGGSRQYMALRQMMYNESGAYGLLMDKLTEMVIEHLKFQVEAGAEVVMLFDSWAGALTAEDYERFALPWTQRIHDALRGVAPRVAFAGAGDHLFEMQLALGVECVAVDFRTDFKRAMQLAGGKTCLQGNLDPGVLLSSPDEVTRRTDALLAQVGGRPGHILGLGHGVMKATDPACVAAFVDCAKGAASCA